MLNKSNELMTGLLTNAEFAKWRGVTVKTIERRKSKYIEELEIFADFHIEGRKVIIDEVIIPAYCKKGVRNYEIIKENIPKVWNENGLDTGVNVSRKLIVVTPAMGETSRYRSTLKGIKEVYPFCKSIWAKEVADGRFEPFTDEDIDIWTETFREMFKEPKIMTLDVSLFNEMVISGEITKEQAFDALTDEIGFSSEKFILFKDTIQARIGYAVKRVRDRMESAF